MTFPLPIVGTTLLKDSEVTEGMTAFAVTLLHSDWPMFAQSGPQTIDGKTVIARIEWHPAEPSIPHEHRGVTLYEVTGVLRAEGIDVSSYQPAVDWTVVQANKSFAFIKATEALSFVDSHYADHIEGADAAGLMFGAYHFFRPEIDAIAQATHFLDVVSTSPLGLPTLPLVLDVEINSHGLQPGAVIDGVAAWVDYVTAQTKRRPMVYTMPGFWNTLPAGHFDCSKAYLWVAHFGVMRPLIPNGWSDWTFWQYTDKGGAQGVGPNMDLDVFNGTANDLATMTW